MKTTWDPVNRRMFLRGFVWHERDPSLGLPELKRLPSDFHFGYDMATRCPYADKKRLCKWLTRETPGLGKLEPEDLWNA